MSEAAGDPGLHLAGLTDDAVEATMLDDHAGGDEALAGEGFEVALERFTPAIGVEQFEIPLKTEVAKPSGVDRGIPSVLEAG
jgi:hypothetical protein